MIDVVGLGDGGLPEVPDTARRLVLGARVLLGGRRHLDLVPAVAAQERHAWPMPLPTALPGLLVRVGACAARPTDETGVVVLASGDPLLSGMGTTLVRLLGAEAVRVHPAVSSEALARARMRWAFEETVVVSLVGRSPDRIRRHLTPRARLVVLCADGSTPAKVADLLVAEGCGDSAMTAWWHLGGSGEGSRTALAVEWGNDRTPDLIVVCVVVVAAAGALARAHRGAVPGRPETVFEHDGQITKRTVRAAALSNLRPTPGAHLWDLGAGSGAVGIEWALAAPRARTTAVERDPVRADRVRRNADRHGLPDEVHVVTGEAADALEGLAPPDAVFVGGGLTTEVLDAAWAHLVAGGRIVAHAVTLGAESVLVEAYGRRGGELTRITVEHVQPLGRHLSWTPARPVVQWSATKPSEPAGRDTHPAPTEGT